MLHRKRQPIRRPCNKGIHVQQSQRQQPAATATHGFPIVRMAMLGLLLLLSLLSSLWQSGAQAAFAHLTEISASATDADRQGDEKYLQEENPAKLRRVAKVPIALAAPSEPADHLILAAMAASPARSLIPATITVIARSAPGRRQQRGQAPPLA